MRIRRVGHIRPERRVEPGDGTTNPVAILSLLRLDERLSIPPIAPIGNQPRPGRLARRAVAKINLANYLPMLIFDTRLGNRPGTRDTVAIVGINLITMLETGGLSAWGGGAAFPMTRLS